MAAELPEVVGVSSNDLQNYFFLEKTISSVWMLQHPNFVSKTSNQHPQCFPLMELRSTLEARIMQVKEKHKYRGPTTKLNSFSPAARGCSRVVKRPRTLPIRNDTHCIDTSFGNLAPSCRCLAFFFSRKYYFEGPYQCQAGLALVSW